MEFETIKKNVIYVPNVIECHRCKKTESKNWNYTMLKNILNGPLNIVDSKIVSKYQNNGLGAKTFLTNLVNSELIHIDFGELICV